MKTNKKILYILPITLIGLSLTSCEGIPYITKEVFLDQFEDFYISLIDSESSYKISDVASYSKHEEKVNKTSFLSTFTKYQFDVNNSYLRVATYSRNDDNDASESFVQKIISLYKFKDEDGTYKYYEVCYQHWDNKDKQLHKQYKMYDEITFNTIFNERIKSIKDEIKTIFVDNYDECRTLLGPKDESSQLFNHEEYGRTSYDANYFGQDNLIKAMVSETGSKEITSTNSKKKKYNTINKTYNIKIDNINITEKEINEIKKVEEEAYYLYETFSLTCDLKYVNLGAEAYSSIEINSEFDKQ